MPGGFSRYDRPEADQSRYCYPGTDVLINRENITNAKSLAKYEADMTIIRQYELEIEQVVKGNFGITHLKRIHKYIFQDIYPFAGKFRLENISKGNTEFCKSEFIEDNMKTILNELKGDNYLKGLNAEDFSMKAAYYMSEINMIHPFREGNGRTIREFIRQLAYKNGHIINWSLVNKNDLMQSIMYAVGKDYGPLSTCIIKAIENK
ncbi:MAG: cell filamentation protein Fic [Syntrophomonadaceae bacterium]|jgi:cell filamentation protein|nr:cell filamentation protein Fic [Syntrophomonadaceae bacterium]